MILSDTDSTFNFVAALKFIKPKQAAKASADPDDYDSEDEEDYINEDEPEQEEETEETK